MMLRRCTGTPGEVSKDKVDKVSIYATHTTMYQEQGLQQHRRKDGGGENNMCRFEANYIDKAGKVNVYVQSC